MLDLGSAPDVTVIGHDHGHGRQGYELRLVEEFQLGRADAERIEDRIAGREFVSRDQRRHRQQFGWVERHR